MKASKIDPEIQNNLKQSILHKELVFVTYQAGVHKITEELAILMDIFSQNGSSIVLTETGLSIPLNQIKAITPFSKAKH